ncbi:MAG: GAF domain-containing sensor histidine kinase [Dehalococcoidia bacterium]
MNSPELQAVLLGIIEVQPVEALLRRLAAAAREMTGADFAALGAYDENRRLEHFETVGLTYDERAAMPHAPHGLGLLGEFAIDPRTVQLEDFRQHRASVRMPSRHVNMEAFLGVPLLYGGQVLGAFYVTKKPGGAPFSNDDRAQLEALAPYAALAIRNARTMESEQRQRVAAQALADAARALQEVDAPEDAARVLVRAAGQLLGDGECVVCWVSADGDAVQSAATIDGSRLQTEVCAMVESGLPPGRHERPGMLPGADVTIYCGELPDGGMLALAASIPSNQVAGVHLALRTLHDIGVAGHAHLARRAAEAALERYALRDGIARDLHDDIIQAIYAIGLGLHRARMRESITKEEAIETATTELSAVIGDLRAYIGHLTGDELPGTALLTERLRSILDAASSCDWTHRIEMGHEPLTAATERAVYLIARELISNVERHAQAGHATLTVSRDAEGIHLRVIDDGVGFDRNRISPDRVGVRSVEQRAVDLGGSLIFETAPGRGTTVSVTIPIVATGVRA